MAEQGDPTGEPHWGLRPLEFIRRIARRRATDRTAELAKKRPPYKGHNLFGVPLIAMDREYLAKLLKEEYYPASHNNWHLAVSMLLERNEHVVSRCGLLVHFSAILIALSIFIAERKNIFIDASWKPPIFYAALGVWVVSTIRLLWGLRHVLPPPWELGTEQDFLMTADLFLRRMRTYNISLVVTIACFFVVSLLFVPVDVYLKIVDRIFGVG